MKWLGPLAGVAALSIGLGLGAVALSAGSGGSTAPQTTAPTTHGANAKDGLGIRPGKIKHVWLIILEHKSYDATFTGLNNNTYLWKSLPKQGALLTQYYGTGHFSLDNYISMASGQANQTDTQSDCPFYTSFNAAVDTSGSLKTNPNYGQAVSNAGPNAAPGANGCVYPSSVRTLFNQLDAARVSWKGYAQDLNTTTTPVTDPSGPTHSQGEAYCGSPYTAPAATGSTSQPNPGGANATDQYVPKHFPFPWFQSILSSGDCNAKHIANVFDPANGLYHDLQSASTTPAFSWLSPNNCSDAHYAVCHANNLSGGFSNPTTANPPVNYTGGLYASDLFLEHVVPEIEASPAFKQGGLIVGAYAALRPCGLAARRPSRLACRCRTGIVGKCGLRDASVVAPNRDGAGRTGGPGERRTSVDRDRTRHRHRPHRRSGDQRDPPRTTSAVGRPLPTPQDHAMHLLSRAHSSDRHHCPGAA